MKSWKLLTALGIVCGLVSCADYDLYNKYMNPQTPSLAVAGVADSSVTLQWSMYTGGDFKNYKIYKSTHDGVDTTDSVAATFPFVSDTTINIASLMPGKTYYFMVTLATNSGGFAASNNVHATLPTQLGQFTLFNPDSVTDSSLVLHWSRCTLNVDNYRIYTDTAKQADSTSMLIKSVYTDTNTSINGLVSGHRYWFRVYGLKNSTIVALSTSNQAYLPATIKPNPVVLGITGVTDSSIALKWSSYAGNDFRNYRVYYSLNDNVTTTDSLIDSMIFKTDTTKIVQQLLPDTRYYFRVITSTQSGALLAGNIKDATTDSQGIKKAIVMLDPDSVTETSLRLHWSKYGLAFDRYRIFADTAPAVDHSDLLVKTSLTTDTVATITGLMPNKAYWFRIYAQKGATDIAYSDSLKVTTLIPISHPQPVSLRIAKADSAIILQWTSYSGNDFKNYKVYLSHNVSVETTDSLKDSLTIQSDTTILVKPIVAGTLYSFRVFVTNQQNASTPSNIADTTILQTPLANLVLSDPPDTVDSSFVVLHWAPYTPTPDQYIIYADTAISEKFTDATSRYFGIDTNVKIIGLASNHYYAFRVYALKNQARVAASNIVAVKTK